MTHDDAFIPPITAMNARVYRLVPSIFPPTSLFDDVADPEDLEEVYFVESMTNDRLRDEVGDIFLVPAEDRVVGPGSTPIMAAFTHLNPDGGRFTDHTYGAYYAALELETAVSETIHHREEFLKRTQEGPIDVDMRAYGARLTADLHDIRGFRDEHPEFYEADNYAASQALAAVLRRNGSDGIAYASVRHAGGNCVAVFRPRLLSKCRQERHLTYRWDGSGIRVVYEKSSFR